MKKYMLFGVFAALISGVMSSRATDYFTEDFGYGFDLDGLSLTFTPDGSTDYFSASGKVITALPVDASTHNDVFAGYPGSIDDTYRTILFPGPIIIYGFSFSGVNIGSNGYLTFTEADTIFTPSLENHFDTVRISTLFVDLDPRGDDGGSIRSANLSDRFVVTFLAVPNYGSSSSKNTFQTEIFHDGTIRMSWLGVASSRGIVGLSQGNGIPADFVETDLSSLAWDLDDDTIPNSWELQYFSNSTGCVASVDSDGDGMDNMSEYICGTHPRDRTSVFQAVCKSSATGGPVIEWHAVEGRIYNVFESHNLALPNSFSPVPGDIVFPNNSYTPDVGGANSAGFYKIDVKLDD